MTEMVDIFNEDWSPTGEVMDKIEARRLHKWHKVAAIWIMNPRGELLFARRASGKKYFPNHWAAPACGNVRAGESVIDGAIREAQEELRINIDPALLSEVARLNFAIDAFWHLHTVLIARIDMPVEAFKFDTLEVAEVKYFPWRELAAMSPAEREAAHFFPSDDLPALFEYLEKSEKGA
ncbi:MAG: NUDIX domain-containing protein [Alphaproteobacteria bacterium]|nr:NUDIX domain-containing protein [Alphaproteobacteria bacterium]